jgi:hypothetical protein
MNLEIVENFKFQNGANKLAPWPRITCQRIANLP